MNVSPIYVIFSGLMTGGIYALISMGLSLQYGVARVLNVSHGEFIMLGALSTYTLNVVLGIDPLVCLAIVGPVLLILGFLLHRTLFTSIRTRAPSPAAVDGNTLLAAFGLIFIIQNIALLIWTGPPKTYLYLNYPVSILGEAIPANRLVAMVGAIITGVVFYFLVARTRLGKAIRAAAQDPTTAGLMGININRLLPLCFGLGAFMAGIAGVLISMASTTLTTTMGMNYTVIALIVVALGGLGSIPGSFIGGFILGLIGAVVSFLQPGLVLVAYYAIFLILLLVRPTGILGRR
jgi:branched-chain amino acid transport system permease protein